MNADTRDTLDKLWQDLESKWDVYQKEFREGLLDFEGLRLGNARAYTDYLIAKGIVVDLDGDYTQDGVLSGEKEIGRKEWIHEEE